MKTGYHKKPTQKGLSTVQQPLKESIPHCTPAAYWTSLYGYDFCHFRNFLLEHPLNPLLEGDGCAGSATARAF